MSARVLEPTSETIKPPSPGANDDGRSKPVCSGGVSLVRARAPEIQPRSSPRAGHSSFRLPRAGGEDRVEIGEQRREVGSGRSRRATQAAAQRKAPLTDIASRSLVTVTAEAPSLATKSQLNNKVYHEAEI